MNKIVKLMASAAFAFVLLVPGSVKGWGGDWSALFEVTNASSHDVTVIGGLGTALVPKNVPYVQVGITYVQPNSTEVKTMTYPLFVDGEKICLLECLYFANPAGISTQGGRVVAHINGLDGKVLVDKWADWNNNKPEKASAVFEIPSSKAKVRVEGEAIKEAGGFGPQSKCKFRVFDA